jgi:DNA polymerase-3 subunit gamma/tau
VELALIKLSYLQQALEIVSGGEQFGVKKKLADQAKPVAFRAIQPMELSKKYKDIKRQEPVNVAEAKLIIDTSVPKKEPLRTEFISSSPQAESVSMTGETKVPTLGTLSKIRQQFISRQVSEDSAGKPLQDDTLKQAWLQFTRSLRENKNSAVQSFQRAVLEIKNSQLFEIITHNNLEQKFIEQEKRNLSDYLQQFFNNKSITFTVRIVEKQEDETTLEKQLSKKEQYQQMIEQYPFVKELKDRLKLELDY